MEWENYRQIYLNYELSVTQIRLISLISCEILRDFPYKIPKELGMPIFKRLKKIFETISDWSHRVNSGNEKLISNKENRNNVETKNEDSRQTDETYDPYVLGQLFDLFTMMGKRGILPKDMDLRRLQYFQELVMHYSNFEGILADSIRAICHTCPNVMKKRKTMEWKEILSCSSWDELIDILIEKFVREMGWMPLQKRLNTFSDDFKLKIQFDEDDIRTIEELELVRNLIVHNGGKVDQKYVMFKKASNPKVGDYIPADNEYLKNISVTLKMVASEIYIEISKKYFDKDEKEILEDIWHRRGF